MASKPRRQWEWSFPWWSIPLGAVPSALLMLVVSVARNAVEQWLSDRFGIRALGIMVFLSLHLFSVSLCLFAVAVLLIVWTWARRAHSQPSTFEIDTWGHNDGLREPSLKPYGKYEENDIWTLWGFVLLRVHNPGADRISVPASGRVGNYSVPGVNAAIVRKRWVFPKKLIPEPTASNPLLGFAALLDADKKQSIPSLRVDGHDHSPWLRWECCLHLTDTLMRQVDSRYGVRVIVRPVGETMIYQDMPVDWDAARIAALKQRESALAVEEAMRRAVPFNETTDAVRELAARRKQQPYVAFLDKWGLSAAVEALCKAGYGASNSGQIGKHEDAQRYYGAFSFGAAELETRLQELAVDDIATPEERDAINELRGLLGAIKEKFVRIFGTVLSERT